MLVKSTNVCEVVQDRRCSAIKPSRITPPEESLVYLRLYYHNSTQGWGERALVNLTLPAPAWKELKFQYTFLGSLFSDSCYRFTLFEHVNSTLMYDCDVMSTFGDKSWNTKLTVESDRGEGASYLFRIPAGLRIDPEKTCPSDWHVFFYIHREALQLYNPLPVTIQSAPFGQVTYSVMLARCHDADDNDCNNFDKLHHTLKTKNTSDDLWTVYLSKVTTGGTYVVMVQIVSDWCPKPKGCHVSVSPTFKVRPSSTWIVFLLTICMILIFLVSILFMVCQRRKINKDFFKDMKNKQPTVLLVYHPESQAALSFVNTFAEFLRKTCYVTYFMVDEGVANENPTNWTKTHMDDANRVLFIVPKDSEVQSFTTIRNQWKVALNHCNDHEFITSQKHAKRLAKLVHPASGNVPFEIKNVRCFELSHNPAALANWLHDGSFLDQTFLWLPHIRSFTRKGISPNWTDVKLAAQMIGSSLATPNSEFLAPQTLLPQSRVMVEQDLNDGESSDDNEASNGLDFDQEIPGVSDGLCELGQGDSSSPENSANEDDIFP